MKSQQRKGKKAIFKEISAYGILAMIRLYQWTISPLLGSCCRFYPNCSEYALEAVKKHGAKKGSWLTFKRLLKCHPWHPGGCDFVP